MKTLTKHNNTYQRKSTTELQATMHQVLQLAQTLGADEAAVSVNHDSGFAVDVRMGEVETVAFSEDKGVSTTVYIGHQKGSASSSDTTTKALEAMVHAAIEIAKISAGDPCFALPEKALLNDDSSDLDLFHHWNITPEQAIAKALHCERHALNIDSRIDNTDGTHMASYDFCHGYATSQGFEHFAHSTRHTISCSLIATAQGAMQRDYEFSTARHPAALETLEAIAQSAVARTVSKLGARKLKTQKAPVLFSSRLSAGILSALIAAISGTNLYRKQSFLLEALDQQIFPDWVRIHEQPRIPRALGSAVFDAEGVPTRQNVFVEQGILRQYALSCFSARKLGLATTANCGGVYNLTADANVDSFDDLVKMMDTGFLVTELMGQGINGMTGDYSRGASGFWVERGEIQYPVEEVTIAGNLMQMFLAIRAIGHDLNPNIATRCGSILIGEMMIAGT